MKDRFKFRAWMRNYFVNSRSPLYNPDKVARGERGYYVDVMMDVASLRLKKDSFSIGGTACYYLTPDTVLMQSTGIKDKNNKLIFEGDLLKTENRGIVLVKYTAPSFYLIQKSRVALDWNCGPLEIVGNIFEDTNLWKS